MNNRELFNVKRLPGERAESCRGQFAYVEPQRRREPNRNGPCFTVDPITGERRLYCPNGD